MIRKPIGHVTTDTSCCETVNPDCLQNAKRPSHLDTFSSRPKAYLEAEPSRSSNSESMTGQNYNGVASRVSVAALGGMTINPVHAKSPKTFQHERPTNSACFKAIPRTAQMGGYAHAQESMTAESVGPGSYRSSLHRHAPLLDRARRHWCCVCCISPGYLQGSRLTTSLCQMLRCNDCVPAMR